MHIYKFYQLILFFFVYGILGWIYESALVSITSKKLSNRGFVKGPILPIYGLGAVAILYITAPFVDYPVAVFFIGLISATILEYFAGYLLEKIFKVRYWDYTGRFANINGYICLLSVVVWGFFSIFMVYFLHHYVSIIINKIPIYIQIAILIIAIIIFTIDLYVSFKEAYDIRVLFKNIRVLHAEFNETELVEKLETKIKEFESTIDKLKIKKAKIIKANPRAKFNKDFRAMIDKINKNIYKK